MKFAFVLAGAALVIAALHFRPPAPAQEPAFHVVAASPTPSLHRTVQKTGRAATEPIVVYVAGAVAHPGLVTLPAGSRTDLAVRHAGGLAAAADSAAVNLAARLSDGEEIVVPREGEPQRTRRTTSTSPKPHVASAHRKHSHKLKHPSPSGIVDLNTASEDAIAGIPGVGTRLAERIVEFRDINGAFDSLDELADIEGISQRKIDVIAPFVTVSSSSASRAPTAQ